MSIDFTVCVTQTSSRVGRSLNDLQRSMQSSLSNVRTRQCHCCSRLMEFWLALSSHLIVVIMVCIPLWYQTVKIRPSCLSILIWQFLKVFQVVAGFAAPKCDSSHIEPLTGKGISCKFALRDNVPRVVSLLCLPRWLL